MYPGVWRHGDWIRITERGSAVIEGRSDSTLNRQGIRFGTSELYGVVEGLPEVRDSLVIGLELPGGRYWMPLFVVLADGVELDDARDGTDQGRDPRGAVAAPRPGRHHRRPGRPAHADRQEDGSAGQAAPAQAGPSRRSRPRARSPTRARSTSSSTYAADVRARRLTGNGYPAVDGRHPTGVADRPARRRARRARIVGQEQRRGRRGARGRLPLLRHGSAVSRGDLAGARAARLGVVPARDARTRRRGRAGARSPRAGWRASSSTARTTPRTSAARRSTPPSRPSRRSRSCASPCSIGSARWRRRAGS